VFFVVEIKIRIGCLLFMEHHKLDNGVTLIVEIVKSKQEEQQQQQQQ